jgi:hypothetical protein
MSTTVDFETAKDLCLSGFPQPGYPIPNQSEVVGKIFYSPEGNKFLGCWQEESSSIVLQPYLHNKQIEGVIKVVYAPTALEIMGEMPPKTRLEKVGEKWECIFELPTFLQDFREDRCPHRACALAYIAWKKGMEV